MFEPAETLLVKGGRVYDHGGDTDQPPVADILIRGDRIERIGPDIAAEPVVSHFPIATYRSPDSRSANWASPASNIEVVAYIYLHARGNLCGRGARIRATTGGDGTTFMHFQFDAQDEVPGRRRPRAAHLEERRVLMEIPF